MFEGEWDQRSLFGWESSIAKIYGEHPQADQSQQAIVDDAEETQPKPIINSGQQHYCDACRKGFSNPTVFEFHLKGKRHIKAEAQ